MKRLKRIGLVLFFALGISSVLAAQDPSILLEKALYAEETLGNLNDAIGIYQQVVLTDTATRATSALALFRLGMCYQKSGSAQQSQQAFAKLLKLYPEQQELISNIPVAASELAFNPAPWVDGEFLQMSILVPSGRQIGTLIYKFASTVDSGNTAWRVQTIQSGGAQYTSALIDAASFIPISSLVTESYAGREYRASYGAQQIENVISGSSSKQKTFQLIRTTYDDQQVVQILRCLPLREGFKITIPIFSSNSNDAFIDVQIAMLAKERITVSAGTFDCYKISLTRGNQSPSSTYWISADGHAYIVKANEYMLLAGTSRRLVDMELSAIGIAEKEQPANFENGMR
jgi:hypothetical protein